MHGQEASWVNEANSRLDDWSVVPMRLHWARGISRLDDWSVVPMRLYWVREQPGLTRQILLCMASECELKDWMIGVLYR
jgi:hypothetical protein